MAKSKLTNYRRDAVKYAYKKTHFIHNYEADYQLVLVSTNERENVETIIANNYKLAAVFDVVWSNKHLANNVERLGLEPALLSCSGDNKTVELKAIVFQIAAPEYKLTASGDYCIDWQSTPLASVLNNTLLISDSIERFFYTSTLILGLATLQSVFSSNEVIVQTLTKELEGAHGWDNFTDMFNVANVCANWLVLRNAEFLPDNFWGNDKDIDMLCDNVENVVFALNAKVKGQDGANFEVTIAEQKIDVDMRVIGDEYYDRLWQSDMLLNKVYKGVVPLMNKADYFYSLLYHARIHKAVVKPIYIPRLTALATELGFELNAHVFTSGELCATFMDDYFSSKGYNFTYPSDYPCYESLNRDVIQHLTQIKITSIPLQFKIKLLKNRLFLLGCKLFPRSLKELAKRVLGR